MGTQVMCLPSEHGTSSGHAVRTENVSLACFPTFATFIHAELSGSLTRRSSPDVDALDRSENVTHRTQRHDYISYQYLEGC
jgi:hypothetical protein